MKSGKKVKDGEVTRIFVGEEEMKKLVANLPDWGKVIRRKMAEKFQGYKYWVDGVRVDEYHYLMRREGDRQWFLTYLHYRICGKGKRTRFCTKLVEAWFIDSTGKVGKYNLWINNRVDQEIDRVRVVYRSTSDRLAETELLGDLDMIDGLKYSQLGKWYNEGIGACYHRLIFDLADLYLHFPQVEFIYKMSGMNPGNSIIYRLLNLYDAKEYQEVGDLIERIRICKKHKYPMDHLISDLWWDYIKGIRKLGKDWRNPHYLCPENLREAHDKVMKEIRKKFLEPIDKRIINKFNKLKQRFIGLEFQEDGLKIRTLDSPKAYIEESRAMHNCIETLEYYIKPSSLILCATLDGKRLADIELRLRDYKILQCCGPCNSVVKERAEIEALIGKNIPKIQERQFMTEQKIFTTEEKIAS